jgi:hypothetical protein
LGASILLGLLFSLKCSKKSVCRSGLGAAGNTNSDPQDPRRKGNRTENFTERNNFDVVVCPIRNEWIESDTEKKCPSMDPADYELCKTHYPLAMAHIREILDRLSKESLEHNFEAALKLNKRGPIIRQKITLCVQKVRLGPYLAG